MKREGRNAVAIFNSRADNSLETFIGSSQHQINAMTVYRGVHMNIRYGNTDDAKMLSEFGARAFYDAFAKDNTPENMEVYLKKSFSREIQFNEPSEPDVIFLIAESEGIPIGYAQLMMNSKDELIRGPDHWR